MLQSILYIAHLIFFRIASEMSFNTKKWQDKCSELQKALDDAILIKDEFVDKFNQMNQKANTLHVSNFI